MKEATGWLEDNADGATADDFQQRKERLADAVYPITSKLYGGGGHEEHEDHDEPDFHDEL